MAGAGRNGAFVSRTASSADASFQIFDEVAADPPVIFINVALILGIIGFFVSAIVIPRKPERVYVPYAYYERTNARGVPFKSREECIAQAKRSFKGTESNAVEGIVELPADGIQAPYEYGCVEYDHTGKPTGATTR
jgi:hypothetical protein